MVSFPSHLHNFVHSFVYIEVELSCLKPTDHVQSCEECCSWLVVDSCMLIFVFLRFECLLVLITRIAVAGGDVAVGLWIAWVSKCLVSYATMRQCSTTRMQFNAVRVFSSCSFVHSLVIHFLLHVYIYSFYVGAFK